jgi:glucuronate isomerase
MNKEQFHSELDKLNIYDAHTHLEWNRLCAVDFWEIVHYFWFLRELQGAGYPQNYDVLSEEKRIDAFLPAYKKTKGTGMNYSVRRIFKDLYDLEITDKKSVYDCMEKVKASSVNAAWARETAAKGNIKYTVTNDDQYNNFTELNGVNVWFPRIDGRLGKAAREIIEAETSGRADVARKTEADILSLLSKYKSEGARAFMTTLRSLNKKTWKNSGSSFESIDDCYIYLLHVICTFAQDNDMNIQLLMGMEHNYCDIVIPVNDDKRIVNLYGLFEKYKCNFDLVAASEVNNLDIVNAAHIFPNVFAGGMWWFNFRPSIFMDAMAKRFDVLPSTKSYLSISDSRCFEWCYGKIVLIKKIAGDFLAQKVKESYISFEDALEIAGDWFYESAKQLYGTRG